MVTEICCETRFRCSREHSICLYKRWTFFSFYIMIKETLLRKCFEYAHTITKDWTYFESGLGCQSTKQIHNQTSLIHNFCYFLRNNLKAMRWQSTWYTDNYQWRVLSKKIGYPRVFGKTGNSKRYKQKEFTGQCVLTRERVYFSNKTIAWLF